MLSSFFNEKKSLNFSKPHLKKEMELILFLKIIIFAIKLIFFSHYYGAAKPHYISSGLFNVNNICIPIYRL